MENVRPQSRFHPRCGTSFLLVVIVLGIFVGLLIQIDNTRCVLRSDCAFAGDRVRGVRAEPLGRAARPEHSLCAFSPGRGKQLQHLTTNEPDDGMIECAIRALELVIPEEKGKDAW